MPRWPARTFSERLHARIDTSAGPDTCHLWTAATNPRGYGHLGIGTVREGTRRVTLAHREIWRETHGEIPASTPHVLHRCDNPSCCNVRHLFLGTNADNIRDAAAKGRKTWRGRACRPLSIDTEQRVRSMYQSGGVTIRELAAEFGMSYGRTRRVVQS